MVKVEDMQNLIFNFGIFYLFWGEGVKEVEHL
jgi:hypothetical protein